MPRAAKPDSPIFVKELPGTNLRPRLEAQLRFEHLPNVTILARVILERWLEEREKEQTETQQSLFAEQRSA
jgi:hypothetical protein